MSMTAVGIPNLATSTPLWLALVATAVGAVLGGLLALEARRFDIFGIFIMAGVLGFGGGMIRDFLVGELPPLALRDPSYLVVVILATALVLAYGKRVVRFRILLVVFDAAMIGLFAQIGTQAGFAHGLELWPSVFIGTLAAVGGGIVADLFLGRTPIILRPGSPYSLAAVAGAASYGIAVTVIHIPTPVASALSITIAFAARMTWYWLGIETLPMEMGVKTKWRFIWKPSGQIQEPTAAADDVGPPVE